MVYVIESVTYGVELLVSKPEQARYERVRAFETNNS